MLLQRSQFTGPVLALLACAAWFAPETVDAPPIGLSQQAQDTPPDFEPSPAGALIFVADGTIPAEALIEALAMTGKEGPIVAINRTAAEVIDPEAMRAWSDLGVTDLLPIDPDTPELAKEHIARADLIWLSDSKDPDAYLKLWRANLVPEISMRRDAGAVVGGAGRFAEMMCVIYLVDAPDPAPLIRGASRRGRGMALWSNGVLEASFGTAGALEHLMTVLLDRPRLTAVGLGPGASVLVTDKLRVITGHAWIFNPKDADVTPAKPGELQSARNLSLSIMRAGESADISAR
jgi:hypothetical protein